MKLWEKMQSYRLVILFFKIVLAIDGQVYFTVFIYCAYQQEFCQCLNQIQPRYDGHFATCVLQCLNDRAKCVPQSVQRDPYNIEIFWVLFFHGYWRRHIVCYLIE